MARHPDVKEREIIEAAMALEAKGKMPKARCQRQDAKSWSHQGATRF
jgi:hypothetical protein